MSADNGIYIAKFPTKDGVEYRVAHCQAIDNCDDREQLDPHLTDLYRVMYFGKTEPWPDFDAAEMKARYLEAEILGDDYCPILEYGVCYLEFDRPLLNMSYEEAYKRLTEDYWKDRS